MVRVSTIITLLAFLFCFTSCEKNSKIAEAAAEVRIEAAGSETIEYSKLKKSGDDYIKTIKTAEGLLSIIYSTASSPGAVMLDCEFEAACDADSLSFELCFYALTPESVRDRFCVPFSLPYLREKGKNIIPERFISNGETCNNTFSLITEEKTYSVSILPAQEQMNTAYDMSAADDYAVALFSNEGSVRFKGFFGRNIKSGTTLRRRFIMSATANVAGCFESGYHIGEYMNHVHYPGKMNLGKMYDCSMDYLLHNPFAFGQTPVDGRANFYGSIHSQTGKPFGNGNAVYAMYGNSFSLAALNRYLKKCPDDEAARKRLDAVESFLLDSDVRTPDGAYWSMLDLGRNAGYVDQAYRKWLETHATAWVTYFILDAVETSGNAKYKVAAEESLDWMLSIQKENGSMPKYFENGQPSKESMGDIAWAALSFLKAWQLGMGEEFKEAALKALDWMETNVVNTRQYFGSFEDVGGINDSYCPSVTARAFISAYSCTGKTSFLDDARKALSVSLAWVSTGFTTLHYKTYDESLRITPSYAQIESVTCYYPCSYTLPMMYLACMELGCLIEGNPAERDFWLGIADNFDGVSDFMLNNEITKCRYGMEWLPAPFLVFSEWGNMQLCWTIGKASELTVDR